MEGIHGGGVPIQDGNCFEDFGRELSPRRGFHLAQDG
jgi:hypothetical protein